MVLWVIFLKFVSFAMHILIDCIQLSETFSSLIKISRWKYITVVRLNKIIDLLGS